LRVSAWAALFYFSCESEACGDFSEAEKNIFSFDSGHDWHTLVALHGGILPRLLFPSAYQYRYYCKAWSNMYRSGSSDHEDRTWLFSSQSVLLLAVAHDSNWRWRWRVLHDLCSTIRGLLFVAARYLRGDSCRGSARTLAGCSCLISAARR
jgi:hypothetical protein